MSFKINSQFFNRFSDNFIATLFRYPAESLVTTFFTVLVYLKIHDVWSDYDFNVAYLPQFFTLCFLLNKIFPRGIFRILYYVSFLPALSVLFYEYEYNPAYLVSLALCPLSILCCCPHKDNNDFARQAFGFLTNLSVSYLLSSVAFLLALAIYYSVTYIFGIYSRFLDFQDIIIFFYIWVFPLAFLYFDRMGAWISKTGKFAAALCDFFLSPALLIYTAILYIYFITIAFAWELPVGGLAIIIFVFSLVAVISKAFQPLLPKQRYSWFYNYFHFFALPVVAMFWFGTFYRIHAYGFTESRFYLFLCGVIMTYTVWMPFIKKLNHYLFAIGVSAFLLVTFTYIPKITAGDIGIYSQLRRFNSYIESGENSPSDPECAALRESYLYLKDHGYNKIPAETEDILHNTYRSLYDENAYPFRSSSYHYITRENSEIDLSGQWQKLYLLHGYPQPGCYYANGYDKQLEIFNKEDERVFYMTFEEIRDYYSCLLSRDFSEITSEEMDEMNEQLMTIETDSTAVILRAMHVTIFEDPYEVTISHVDAELYLTK